MSIFKEHKTTADRSATDRRRHREKIDKAIKEGIHDIVAEESIIGKNGKKKIKIPVRGIKEYRFIHGKNNKRVGSAQGKNIKKGQVIKQGNKNQAQGNGNKPGKDKGEEFYEVEISLDELAKYLFDDLNLPELEKKSFPNIFSDQIKRKGYRKEGIRPRLSKKETLKRKIRRKKASIKNGSYDPEDDRFPFHKDDLKYKHIEVTKKNITNAVIFFIMDVSGSMDKSKKFKVRSFFFLLYQFLRYRYDKVDLIFISHTTEAKEVSEDDFFNRGSSGGTYVSSGLNMCLDIIDKRYPPSAWNIYAFHGSDGDNWKEDNEEALACSDLLATLSQLYCYIEIGQKQSKLESTSWKNSRMSTIYKDIKNKSFRIIEIQDKDDVWPEFKRIFGGNSDG